MAETKKPHKAIYRTAAPYTLPTVEKLSQPQHDIISDLLISVLAPIGEHRANLPRRTNTRSRKRKRRTTSQQTEQQSSNPRTTTSEPLAPPDIKQHLLVGYNSVTRHLEDLSALSRHAPSVSSSDSSDLPHIAVVVLFRPMDDLIYSHLPLLCHTASLARPNLPHTRLVLLDSSVEKKVATAMAISPSVSVLALSEDANGGPATTSLLEHIRENVPPIEVPWLKQAVEAQWLGTKIDVS